MMVRMLALISFVSVCFAQTYAIREVTTPVLSGGEALIGITFTKSIRPVDRGLMGSRSNWAVYKYPAGSADPVEVDIKEARFVPDDSVELSVETVANENVSRWVAIFNRLNFPSGSTTDSAQAATGEGPFSAAKSRKEASIYISGSLAAAEKSKPQYAIDSSIELFKDLGSAGALGLQSTLLANQGPEVDPDSIRAFATYRKYFPFRSGKTGLHKKNTGAGLVIDLAGIGGEFNRGTSDPKKRLEKPQVSNLIYASPQALFLLPRWSASAAVKSEIELLGAVEIGHRLETLPLQGTEANITRLLFGSNIYVYTLSETTGRKLMVTGQYRVRLPHVAEPYGFKDASNTFTLTFDRRPRHYTGVDLDYLVTPGLALSVKYKWGSLPPLFPKITNQVSIGLSLMVKQNGQY
jgi:hypothetical protein